MPPARANNIMYSTSKEQNCLNQSNARDDNQHSISDTKEDNYYANQCL